MYRQRFHNMKGKTLLVNLAVIWENNEPIFKAYFPEPLFEMNGKNFSYVEETTWEKLLKRLETEGWVRAE